MRRSPNYYIVGKPAREQVANLPLALACGSRTASRTFSVMVKSVISITSSGNPPLAAAKSLGLAALPFPRINQVISPISHIGVPVYYD